VKPGVRTERVTNLDPEMEMGNPMNYSNTIETNKKCERSEAQWGKIKDPPQCAQGELGIYATYAYVSRERLYKKVSEKRRHLAEVYYTIVRYARV